MASSMPWDLTLATNRSKASQSPRSGWIASCPPSELPMAHGEPGLAGPGARVLFGPLRNEVPMGWIGGMYMTSKPICAAASMRSWDESKVPEIHLEFSSSQRAPSERGKNSYQDANSAALRSTKIG